MWVVFFELDSSVIKAEFEGLKEAVDLIASCSWMGVKAVLIEGESLKVAGYA